MLKIIVKHIKKVEVIETSMFGIERVREVFTEEIKEEVKGDDLLLKSIIEEIKNK